MRCSFSFGFNHRMACSLGFCRGAWSGTFYIVAEVKFVVILFVVIEVILFVVVILFFIVFVVIICAEVEVFIVVFFFIVGILFFIVFILVRKDDEIVEVGFVFHAMSKPTVFERIHHGVNRPYEIVSYGFSSCRDGPG